MTQSMSPSRGRTTGGGSSTDPGAATATGWHGSSRWAVNAGSCFHVAAIVIAPAAVSPSSDLIQAGWDLFQPYLQLLDLNHGYHFFAPEPGDSTLLAFEAERRRRHGRERADSQP